MIPAANYPHPPNEEFPKQTPNLPIPDPQQIQRPINPQINIPLKPVIQQGQGGQPAVAIAGQVQQQGQRMNPHMNNQTMATKIINNAQIYLKSYKMDQQKQNKPISEQKMRDQFKKQLLSNEKVLRGNKDYFEDAKKICQMPVPDLLHAIAQMAKVHLDKKSEVELNIQKNIELLKFLQQYKMNNPQSNFQERENDQQQLVNNYNSKDDSFDAMVDEATKEIRSNNQQQQQQQQEQQQYQNMDQVNYDYNQYIPNNEEVQNNELLVGQQIGYPEDNVMQDEDFDYI